MERFEETVTTFQDDVQRDEKVVESLKHRMKELARVMLRDAETLDQSNLEDGWGRESELPGRHRHDDVMIMTWSYDGFEARFDMSEEFIK